MKITANSICYGTGVEMNVVEHRKPVGATVYLPDGSSYRAKLKRTEDTGSRFHPLIATLVTAGGRLMLAAAMHLIERAGGVYATCDTDSVFPVATKEGGVVPCPGGPHRTAEGEEAIKALSWQQVREIADRFEPLNPYDRELVPGSILEMEDENFDPATGEQWSSSALRSRRSATRCSCATVTAGRKSSEEARSERAPSTASGTFSHRTRKVPRSTTRNGRTAGGSTSCAGSSASTILSPTSSRLPRSGG